MFCVYERRKYMVCIYIYIIYIYGEMLFFFLGHKFQTFVGLMGKRSSWD